MTIEQQIIDRVKELLANITTTNGYDYSPGNNVFEWHDGIYESEELPSLNVQAPENLPAEDSELERVLTLEIVIAAQSNDAPAQVRQMAQDVLSEIQKLENEDFVNCLSAPQIESDSEEKANTNFETMLTFQVNYYTERWQI